MYKILAPGIVLFENVFNEDYVEFIENNIAELFDLKVRTVDDQVVRKSYAIQIHDHQENVDVMKIYNDFDTILKEKIKIYQSIYNVGSMIPDFHDMRNPEMSVFTILKYEIDNTIAFHSDTLDGADFRVGAGLAYLNENYIGGELEFEHFNLKIKPPKNSLIIFPSNWPYSHRSNEIVEGTKYALRCFLVSK